MSYEIQQNPWQHFQTLNRLDNQTSAINSVVRALELQNVGLLSSMYAQMDVPDRVSGPIRETNSILLGIAQIFAKANNIDISDILPEYFPPPPLPNPLRVNERIKAAESKLNTAYLTLEEYKKVLGRDRVNQFIDWYNRLKPEELTSYKPNGLIDTMLANTMKIGKEAHSDLQQQTYYYAKQTELMAEESTRVVEESKCHLLLGEVNRDLWAGSGIVEPININANYAEIPNMDRDILCGYNLIAPNSLKNGSKSQLAMLDEPSIYEYSEREKQIKRWWVSSDFLILDTDDLFSFEKRLKLYEWFDVPSLSVAGDRILCSRFSYFNREDHDALLRVRSKKAILDLKLGSQRFLYARKTGRSFLIPEVLQESQELRMFSGRLPGR